MTTITRQDIYHHLTGEEINPAIATCDIRPILADFGMSEHHLGGDHLVSLAEEVSAAIQDGYSIVTWYGPQFYLVRSPGQLPVLMLPCEY